MMQATARRLWWLALAACVSCAASCASIPKGQFGVTEVEWTGVESVAEDAIEACLVTRERESVELSLGLGSTACGVPPFDSDPPSLELWTQPWTEWPIFDPAIFDLDKERILRWFRARGYYDTQVLGVRTYVDDHVIGDPVECDPDKSSCELEVVVQIREGEPVRVQDVRVESNTTLSRELLANIDDLLAVKRGQRFDETDYEQDKQEILTLLWNASYARAKVTGHVTIDREKRGARVTYKLEPGPACVFGQVTVEGAGDEVPTDLIIQAADLTPGKPYSHEALLEAEQAVFALGAFSAVQLKPQGEGSRVDLVATVRVGRLERWTGGFGVMSGTLQREFDNDSVPQWDIHLVGSYENRSFLGGLRRLRIEERPRLIMLRDFPRVPPGGPRFGSVLRVRFEQPAAFERRTTFFVENILDIGPDPFDGFFRLDLGTKVGVWRPFWRQRFQVRVAVGHDYYQITDSKKPDTASSYQLPFLEQRLTLDLRNNPQRPRRGVYAEVGLQEAFRLGSYGSWNYVRVTPELRGYVPLMWDFVLAARFAIGALFIHGERANDLDAKSRLLGPQSYRLRGGGANSNRGFAAGRLGAQTEGGIRRWEASLELRIPLGEDVGFVMFGDMGDVSDVDDADRGERFRFDHLNTALGVGLRYFTILGAIRFDVGWRIPGWQIAGEPDPEGFELEGWPSAAHLTIGEAF